MINIFGLIFVGLLCIPNILYAFFGTKKERIFHLKKFEIMENIGRYGCIVFMILVVPGIPFGWSSNEAFVVYLFVNVVLTVCYWLIWLIYLKKDSLFKAIMLSFIPSFIFFYSGLSSHYLYLMISALLFGISHIYLSVKNV